MKKIGLLTSGGDAPGMNSAIRSVVRAALKENIEVTGILRGYEGLLSGDIIILDANSVSNISNLGGTMLFSARCEEMKTEKGLKRAFEMAKILGFDALITIGGDGTLAGAKALSELGLNVVGIPGTIDLDLDCTEYTIGFDTAVNTGMEALSKIRDTSSSHERCSIVEVMGRHCGYIAVWCAIASGADDVIVPEVPEVDADSVIRQIIHNRAKGKRHNLIVVAEGIGGVQALAERIEETTGIVSRATILGHLQRGGAPSALDRVHASNMGAFAVEALLQGQKSRVVVVRDGKYDHLDIGEALAEKRVFDYELFHKVRNLSL